MRKTVDISFYGRRRRRRCYKRALWMLSTDIKAFKITYEDAIFAHSSLRIFLQSARQKFIKNGSFFFYFDRRTPVIWEYMALNLYILQQCTQRFHQTKV